MTSSKPFHVYAEDGFESAHATLDAAKAAADRGARKRRMRYVVIKCSPMGFTGGGHGTEVYNTSEVTRVS